MKSFRVKFDPNWFFCNNDGKWTKPQRVVGKTKPLREPIFVIGLTLSNQAYVDEHQLFSMVSNWTPIDFYVRAAEIYNIMIKNIQSENIDIIDLETA